MAGEAAGILCVSTEGLLLLLQRSRSISYPHHWCLPGGWLNKGEDSLTGAIREANEEMGDLPENMLYRGHDFVEWNDVRFDIFVMRTPIWKPVLDFESEGYGWFTFREAMSLPLIRGAELALSKLRSTGVI